MTNGNDTAFIADYQTGTEGMKHYPLTKREYFAAMALQGILNSIPHKLADMKPLLEYYEKEYPNQTIFECVANESSQMADALINALNQR